MDLRVGFRLVLAAFVLAGCSTVGPRPVVEATPHPQWTNSDVLTCKAAATIGQRWEARISKTDRRIVDDLQSGDITAARKRVGKVTKSVLAALNTQVSGACDLELTTLERTMTMALDAFAAPMTVDRFRATYTSIRDDAKALSDKAQEVKGWVQANVPP